MVNNIRNKSIVQYPTKGQGYTADRLSHVHFPKEEVKIHPAFSGKTVLSMANPTIVIERFTGYIIVNLSLPKLLTLSNKEF